MCMSARDYNYNKKELSKSFTIYLVLFSYLSILLLYLRKSLTTCGISSTAQIVL